MFNRNYGEGKIQMIDVYDNVLEDHNAMLIDNEVRRIRWNYDYHSNK